MTGLRHTLAPAAAIVVMGATPLLASASLTQAKAASCLGRAATIAGTPADDTLQGTAGDDVIAGGAGADLCLQEERKTHCP